MRLRLGVEVLGEQRGAADQRLHLGILAVEHAQRVTEKPPAAVGIELRLVRFEVLDESRAVDPAALGGAERVDLQRQSLDTETSPEPCAHSDQLRIHIRTRTTDCLDVYLPELPVASGLRRLVTEHRAQT